MARPPKATIDYFPHDANASNKKTVYILEQKFGLVGYCFWFKLLELLCYTEGHYYDFSSIPSWEFLKARTRATDDDTAKGIMETLVGLEAIDVELYQQKIIWIENLVNNFKDVYSRRETGLPTKPGATPGAPEFTINDNEGIGRLVKLYQEETGRDLTTPIEHEKFKDFYITYPEDSIERAIKEAVAFKAKSPLRYMEKILEDWETKGGLDSEGKRAGKRRTDSKKVLTPDRYTDPDTL